MIYNDCGDPEDSSAILTLGKCGVWLQLKYLRPRGVPCCNGVEDPEFSIRIPKGADLSQKPIIAFLIKEKRFKG